MATAKPGAFVFSKIALNFFSMPFRRLSVWAYKPVAIRIKAKGFGYADYENKVAADANTLFAIGSSTKAFTSSLLGLLRGDDKISFNDNPRKHVPELEFYNDDMNNGIIIKDLMRHTTGLPSTIMPWQTSCMTH